MEIILPILLELHPPGSTENEFYVPCLLDFTNGQKITVLDKQVYINGNKTGYLIDKWAKQKRYIGKTNKDLH